MVVDCNEMSKHPTLVNVCETTGLVVEVVPSPKFQITDSLAGVVIFVNSTVNGVQPEFVSAKKSTVGTWLTIILVVVLDGQSPIVV